MPKGPFQPSQFTSTEFSTAADKAAFGNHFLHFVDSGWKRALFNKSFYNRLSMCFSHIAHYNIEGFYSTWFESERDQLEFLRHTLKFPCYGSPEFTFCDVERAIQSEILKRNLLTEYEMRVENATRATELALLAQLQSKYGQTSSADEPEDSLIVSISPAPVCSPDAQILGFERRPIQTQLF